MPLSSLLDAGEEPLSIESKVFGLLHLTTALTFLNKAQEGGSKSVHGGLRRDSTVWVTKGGEWKLGGFEVCSRLDDYEGAMWVSA